MKWFRYFGSHHAHYKFIMRLKEWTPNIDFIYYIQIIVRLFQNKSLHALVLRRVLVHIFFTELSLMWWLIRIAGRKSMRRDSFGPPWLLDVLSGRRRAWMKDSRVAWIGRAIELHRRPPLRSRGAPEPSSTVSRTVISDPQWRRQHYGASIVTMVTAHLKWWVGCLIQGMDRGF
jgi:hypothetical protein